MKTYGLRDIIGPIMVGPSSSHTAGALALASMARKLFGEQPERAVFTLYGSFAATGSGHGTDKALVAGILGLATDDPRVADAFALAKAAGVQVDIVWDTTTEVAHPNTVDIRCESREGRTLEMRGVSIGGGAAVIRRINGIDVDITGERTSVVVHQRDERGVLAHIAGVLAGCGINIANANLHRTAKRGDAYTVLETDSAVDASVRELLMDHPDIINARVVPATCAGDGEEVPMPEDAEERFARWDYASGEELLALCEREHVTIAQAFRAREEALCAKQGTEAGIDAYLDRVLEVMGNAATEPLGNPQPSVGGLIGGEAAKLRAALEDADPRHRLVDPLAARAAQYGGEEAYLAVLARMGLDRAEAEAISGDYYLYEHLYDLYCTEGSELAPAEHDLETFAQEQGYLTVDHIWLSTAAADPADAEAVAACRARAEEAFSKLNGSADPAHDFAVLAATYSDETDRDQHPSGYTFTVGDGTLPAACEEAAQALEEGQFSGVVEADDGFYLILRKHVDLEAVAPDYFDALLQAAADSADISTTRTYADLDVSRFYDELIAARAELDASGGEVA